MANAAVESPPVFEQGSAAGGDGLRIALIDERGIDECLDLLPEMSKLPGETLRTQTARHRRSIPRPKLPLPVPIRAIGGDLWAEPMPPSPMRAVTS